MSVDAILYELRVTAGVIPPLIESDVRATVVIWRTSPVKDAIEAVEGVAKAKPLTKPKVSFGLTFGSPEPMPGQEAKGFPAGIRGAGRRDRPVPTAD